MTLSWGETTLSIGLLPIGGWFRRCQLYPEAAARANFRIHAASSAHSLRRLFDDGQTNASAGKRFLVMKTFKNLKYPTEMTLFDANAFILHVQSRPFSDFFGGHLDSGGLAILSELDGIAQQILD
jgi:hypothetical protein